VARLQKAAQQLLEDLAWGRLTIRGVLCFGISRGSRRERICCLAQCALRVPHVLGRIVFTSMVSSYRMALPHLRETVQCFVGLIMAHKHVQALRSGTQPA